MTIQPTARTPDTPGPDAARCACRRPAAVGLLLAGLLVAAQVDPRARLGATSETPPLIAAVRTADPVAVRALLAGPVDVNALQPDGATALHWAVHRESVQIADLLIGAGADVDAANDLGITPLLMACARGHGALVERLLAAGADPNAALESGETALMAAARAGSLTAVNALLAAGAPVNATESTRGQSALMWAAANRHPAVTRALLEHGADIGARSRTRRRVYNMGGSRSAGSASRGIVLEEVAEGGSTALLFAARSGDLESARLLLAAGANAHDTAADGNTALNIAALSGHGSLAAFLLDESADPNAAPLGYTALHAAVLRGTLRDRGVPNDDPGAGVPLVRALLERGADPNARLLKGTPVRRWSHDFAFMDRWVGATPALAGRAVPGGRHDASPGRGGRGSAIAEPRRHDAADGGGGTGLQPGAAGARSSGTGVISLPTTRWSRPRSDRRSRPRRSAWPVPPSRRRWSWAPTSTRPTTRATPRCTRQPRTA